MRRGKSVYHCHGKRKGRLIRRFKTVGGAKRFHARISHHRRK